MFFTMFEEIIPRLAKPTEYNWENSMFNGMFQFYPIADIKSDTYWIFFVFNLSQICSRHLIISLNVFAWYYWRDITDSP